MNDSDPRLLSDPASGAPAVLRGALEAARDEMPAAAALARVAARLPHGSLPPPSGSHPPPPAHPPAPGAIGAAAQPSVLSGALIGAALGVVVSGVGLMWPDKPEPPRAAPARVIAAPATAVRVQRPAPSATEEATAAPVRSATTVRPVQAAGSASAAPVVESAAPAGTGSAASAEAAPAPGGGGDAETEAHLLQRAQDALGTNPGEALSLAEAHASKFPAGALGQEREVVAIQALLRLGRGDEARARGAKFLAAFPGSAHRRRIEALLGPAAPAPASP